MSQSQVILRLADGFGPPILGIRQPYGVISRILLRIKGWVLGRAIGPWSLVLGPWLWALGSGLSRVRLGLRPTTACPLLSFHPGVPRARIQWPARVVFREPPRKRDCPA